MAVGGEGGGFEELFDGFAVESGAEVVPEGFDFGENLGVAAEGARVVVENGGVETEDVFAPVGGLPFSSGGPFGEEGGAAEQSAAYHDACERGEASAQGVDHLRCGDVAVEDERMSATVGDAGKLVGVEGPAVLLGCSARVDGEMGQRHGVDQRHKGVPLCGITDSETHFNGETDVGVFSCHDVGDLAQTIRRLQHSGAAAFAHLWNERAAEIQIHAVVARLAEC